MIGKCFQIRCADVDDAGIDKDQTYDAADKTAGKEKSLKERNLRSKKHTDEKHACHPSEHQHGFKGKRTCHFSASILFFI